MAEVRDRRFDVTTARPHGDPFDHLEVQLTRDDWHHLARAAGRHPLHRSPHPRALKAAWDKLHTLLQATPPATKRVLLGLARGEHIALLEAAEAESGRADLETAACTRYRRQLNRMPP